MRIKRNCFVDFARITNVFTSRDVRLRKRLSDEPHAGRNFFFQMISCRKLWHVRPSFSFAISILVYHLFHAIRGMFQKDSRENLISPIRTLLTEILVFINHLNTSMELKCEKIVKIFVRGQKKNLSTGVNMNTFETSRVRLESW